MGLRGTADSAAQHKRMIETPMPALVMTMALPTMVSQLISVIYNTADTYFVAQINTSASAAVGAVFSLQSIIQAFGFGLGMGANSLIARSLGAKRDEDAHSYGSTAFFAAFAVGTLIMAAGLSCIEWLMRFLGSTETMLPYSVAYARIILIAAPIMCPSFVLNNILRGEGDAFFSMIGLCTGGVLNALLDPLFIFGLNMGIAGAALATALSQVVSFLILISVFIRKKSIVKLSPSCVSRSAGTYWEIVKNGLPTICRQGMGSVSSVLLNVAAANYGDAAVAAVTIANKVYLFVRQAVMGLGQGFMPVAGYNYGAGRRDRVRSAFRFTVLVGTCIAAATSALIGLFPVEIMRWFRDDPEVIRIGSTILRVAAFVLPTLGFSTYVNQLYQGLGFPVQATFLASCRQGTCFVPIILILPRVIGLTGIEIAQSAADLMTAIISIPFLVTMMRRLREDAPERLG